MKVTYKDALELFRLYTKDILVTTPIGKKCDIAASKFIEKFSISDDNLRTISLKFKQLSGEKPNHKKSSEAVHQWESLQF